MPTFDFQCPACQHVFEFSRPFGSKDIPPCPKCAHKKTEKLMHIPAISFKGDGFYKTDTSKAAEKPADTPKTEKKAKKKTEKPKKDVS